MSASLQAGLAVSLLQDAHSVGKPGCLLTIHFCLILSSSSPAEHVLLCYNSISWSVACMYAQVGITQHHPDACLVVLDKLSLHRFRLTPCLEFLYLGWGPEMNKKGGGRKGSRDLH